MCNVGPGSSRQHYTGYFPAKGDCALWDNIAKVKTLCNVVLEARDNNEQENILFKVVLILLGPWDNIAQVKNQ